VILPILIVNLDILTLYRSVQIVF